MLGYILGCVYSLVLVSGHVIIFVGYITRPEVSGPFKATPQGVAAPVETVDDATIFLQKLGYVKPVVLQDPDNPSYQPPPPPPSPQEIKESIIRFQVPRTFYSNLTS